MSKEKLFISKIKVYRTPSAEAQGMFSVGMAVANRLNGDGDLVATFDPEDDSERKIGFITFVDKFGRNSKLTGKTEDEQDALLDRYEQMAEDYANEKRAQYKRGTTLGPKWSFGREADDQPDGNATIHIVKFGETEIKPDKDVMAAEAKAAQEKELKK